MPQYAFIEVRFFARAQIQKMTKQVKRLFVFAGTTQAWPDEIAYDFVASTQGALTSDEVIAQGETKLTDYDFIYDYKNPHKGGVSINDLTSGACGTHRYYALNLSRVQTSVMQYINQLGQQGWELVGSPPSFGALDAKFTVELYGPGVSRVDFEGGEQRMYVGQSNNNPTGFAYSLKRQM